MHLRPVLLTLLGFLVLGGVIVFLLFDTDMRMARAAIENSIIAETAAGPVEYAETGNGLPLLSIHGAGGGFDQGLVNAADMVGDHRIIAPSRFGYLRTPVPDDTSAAAQAEAHVALLDALGVARAAVLGVSAGSRSALELALNHPERVTALILVVPATYAPGLRPTSEAREADFPLVLWLVNAGADFAWWTLEHVAPDVLVRFVGVPPEILDSVPAADRAMLMQLIRDIQPLSARYPGINIDSQFDLVERPLETLRMPVLLISARDDLFETLPSAEYAARRIPGAELVVFDTGGHILLGHGEEIRQRIAAFLARVEGADE